MSTPSANAKRTNGTALLVRMPRSLLRDVKRAAKKADLHAAQWVRRACEEQLRRPV